MLSPLRRSPAPPRSDHRALYGYGSGRAHLSGRLLMNFEARAERRRPHLAAAEWTAGDFHKRRPFRAILGAGSEPRGYSDRFEKIEKRRHAVEVVHVVGSRIARETQHHEPSRSRFAELLHPDRPPF